MKNVVIYCVLVLLGISAIEISGQTPIKPPSASTKNQNSTISEKIFTEKTEVEDSKESEPSLTKNSTEIEFSYTEESLSNGFDPWRSASVSIVHRFNQRKAVYAVYSETERFRKRDREVLAGLYQPLGDKWTLFLEGNLSPTHNVISKWSGLAQIERSIDKTLIVKGGYRRSNFNTAKANIFIAEGEKYWGNNRGVYTLRLNNLPNAGNSVSHRVQYSRYYGERASSLNVSASYGRELESLGELGLLQTNVKSLSVSGKHWLKDNLGLTYGFTFHDQGSIYTRRGISVGLRYRF